MIADLVVRWLDELIYLSETEGFVPEGLIEFELACRASVVLDV